MSQRQESWFSCGYHNKATYSRYRANGLAWFCSWIGIISASLMLLIGLFFPMLNFLCSWILLFLLSLFIYDLGRLCYSWRIINDCFDLVSKHYNHWPFPGTRLIVSIIEIVFSYLFQMLKFLKNKVLFGKMYFKHSNFWKIKLQLRKFISHVRETYFSSLKSTNYDSLHIYHAKNKGDFIEIFIEICLAFVMVLSFNHFDFLKIKAFTFSWFAMFVNMNIS